MSINLETCVVCFAAFEDNNHREPCPTCRLKEEMEDKIKDLEEQVESLCIDRERQRRRRLIMG